MFSKILKNKRGFTLVEIIVAAGMIGIISTGVMHLMNNMTRSTKNMEVSSEVLMLNNNIAKVLARQQACTNTFDGVSLAAPGAIANIRDWTPPPAASNIRYSTGTEIGSTRVQINSMAIQNIDLTNIPGGREGRFDLEITYEKLSKSIIGPKEVTKTIEVNVVTNAASQIVSCYNLEGVARANSCEDVGGTFDPVAGTCTLIPYAGLAALAAAADDNEAISEAFLQSFFTELQNTFDQRYLNTVSDGFEGANQTLGNNVNSDNLYINAVLRPNGNVIVANGRYIAMFSDETLKTNIEPIEDILDKVDQLEGVHYNWKETGKKDIGVIAQDVQKVFPELVTTNDETGKLAVKYPQLSAVTIQAVKALMKENDELRSELSMMKEVLCQTNPDATFCKRKEPEKNEK